MTRVVIHQKEDGAIEIYADADASEVFWIDERVPADRIYRMSPEPIPEGMLNGEIGYRGDESAANIRAECLRRLMDGDAPFDVID